MSAARASPKPAPAAGPLTAAITGFSHRTIDITHRPTHANGSSRSARVASGSRGGTDRSRPEQKPLPAPVMSTTRTASSVATASIARGNSTASAWSTAFSRSGRLSVMRCTPVGDVRWMREGMALVDQSGGNEPYVTEFRADAVDSSRENAIAVGLYRLVAPLEERKLSCGDIGRERRKRDAEKARGHAPGVSQLAEQRARHVEDHAIRDHGSVERPARPARLEVVIAN